MLSVRLTTRSAFTLLLSLTAFRFAQAADGPLKLFKNYFVTGNYVVGGIGLRGQGIAAPATAALTHVPNQNYAQGNITLSGVPLNADIVAAFLYWQTAESGPT